jgi:hypothetical protein
MYAYVPAISAGETSVTVTTQFGVSNVVNFVVKKPGWHFWHSASSVAVSCVLFLEGTPLDIT